MKKLVLVLSLLFFACASERATPEPQARAEHRLEVPQAICGHAICAAGVALSAVCDPCATTVCASDPWCCEQMWDATCVGEVTSICGQSCSAPPPVDAGASTCVHPVCGIGAALASGCDACASQLCAQDAYCCAVEWDATCVGEVTSICGQACN